MLKKGDPAPDFDLPAQAGRRVRLNALLGRPVVLYFYPKDDTEGCTIEAQEFNAALKGFERAGATVIGVSPDSPKRHDKFRGKYGLDLTLVSDEDTAVARSYGVWVEKTMFGRKYMGVERATFLISADGRIREVWRKVSPKGHAVEVLETLKGAD